MLTEKEINENYDQKIQDLKESARLLKLLVQLRRNNQSLPFLEKITGLNKSYVRDLIMWNREVGPRVLEKLRRLKKIEKPLNKMVEGKKLTLEEMEQITNLNNLK